MKIRTLGLSVALALGALAFDAFGSLSPYATAQAAGGKARFMAAHSSRPTRTVSRPPPHIHAKRIKPQTPRRVATKVNTNRPTRTNGPAKSFRPIVRSTRPIVRSTGNKFKPPPVAKVIRNQNPISVGNKGNGSSGGSSSGAQPIKNPVLSKTPPVLSKTPVVKGVPLTPRTKLTNQGPGTNPQKPGGLVKGPGKVFAGNPLKVPVIKLGGGLFPFVTGPKRIFRDGRWHVFVPFATLGIVAIGGAYYYPSAYVSTGRRICTGVTPDGCQLNWQLTGFEGGGGNAFQCVRYCPRPGQAPPPPNTSFVALTPPPPPVARGTCDLTIFAEPEFGGASSMATGDQPNLTESGWKDEIASIQIKSGTWDFFTDDGFSGESMRLHPGSRPQLGPEWTKHIGSFQCIQGS